MPVYRLVEEMPAEEFDWWRIVYGLEPWHEEKAEVYGALLAHTTAAPWSKSTSKLTDWLIVWDRDPEAELRKRKAAAIMMAAESRYRERQKQKEKGE